jgi:long-chain acyl-CoA synthetase
MKNKVPFNFRPLTSLKDMIDQSEKLFGKKNAFLLKDGDGNHKGITYTEFKNNIDALGTALINLGLKDKNIAVIGENRYEWCVTYLATVNGTGTIVPLDKELPQAELENLLIRSETAAVVCSGKYAETLKKASGKLASVKYYINMDLEEDCEGFISYSRLLKLGNDLIKSGNRSFLDANIDPEAPNMLIFTSGTTELAKGVLLSHKNICSDIVGVTASIYVDSNDSVLSILPLHHTYECTADFLTMIHNGCTISFNEGLKHIQKNLKEFQPTILLLVPLIIESLYKKIWDQASKKPTLKIKLKSALWLSDTLYKLFKIDIRKKLFKQIHNSIGGRVRLIVAGAAAIDPDVSKGFRSMGIPSLQGYGLTECSPIVTVNRDNEFDDSSAGLPLPGVEVKIDNPDKDGIGEIIVKGDNVMLGYYKNAEATRQTLKDGWFYTGDLGYVDKKGFFYITGRKKNVIVTKNGKNIFPEEVEAYLNKSPYIKESIVWGKPDDRTGDTNINAQIVVDMDAIKERFKAAEFSQEEIRKIIAGEVKSVNKNMPLYKRIDDFTIRENEFEKTTTKKIKRHAENPNN